LEVAEPEAMAQSDPENFAPREPEGSDARLYDCSPVSYVTLCDRGIIRDINLTAAALLGQERPRLLEQPFIQFVQPPYRDSFRSHLTDCRSGRVPAVANLVLAGAEGQSVAAEMRSNVLAGADGGPARFLSVLIDISDRKTLEARLAAAIEAAEQVGRLKDDLLATVSHDLRSPLSAIMLWAHLLHDRYQDNKEVVSTMDNILGSAAAQARIIDDLLDISRAIAGKMTLNLQPGSITKPVQAAVEAVRPAAEARQVRLDVELPEALPQANIDADRIQQIAWNLLNNAIKFSESGQTVTVSLRAVQSGGGTPVIQLKVADRGLGIDPDFLPQLFDRFRHTDSASTQSHRGRGLGLAITRELVQLHGGRLYAQSAGRGQGATFYVEIPACSDGAR
jgi:PAS domain S-box-containing protein